MVVDTMTVTVHECQRCGNHHADLSFASLTNPADYWKWWAMCPSTGEPLLLAIDQHPGSLGYKQNMPRKDGD